jgi:hypothetical protein
VAALRVSHMGHGWPFVDVAVYRQGAEAMLAGRDLYEVRFPGALTFTYPPASALLFTALVPLRVDVLHTLVTALNVLLLPLALALALRLPPARSWLSRRDAIGVALAAAALTLWFEPVWTALRYGQIDLLIAVLVLYDMSRGSACRWQGAGIGLAAGLKLTPAIFAVYLLLTRRTRAALVAAGVFAFTVAVGFAALPADASDFWGGAFLDPSRVGRAENAANQSLRGAFVRVLHSFAVAPAWVPAALCVGALGIAVAAQAGRRGDDARGYSVCVLTALLVSPVSWSHHWALAVPALLLLACGAWRARSRAAMLGCAALAAIALSRVIWWVPVNHPEHSELHLSATQLLYADAYVLVAIALLALAVGSGARDRRARAGLAT